MKKEKAIKGYEESSLFLLTLVLIALSGCLQTRSDIKESEQKQQIKSQLAYLQETQARDQNRHQDIQGSFREFNGRIEVVEHNYDLFHKDLQSHKEQDQNEKKILNEKIALLEQALSTLDKELTTTKQNFLESLGKKHEDKGSDKGPFVLAEEYFAKKEWKKAILNYQQYLERTPKGKSVPLATYKIGVSFQELGRSADAKIFFEDVITKYPDSPQAKSASSRLKNIKNSKAQSP